MLHADSCWFLLRTIATIATISASEGTPQRRSFKRSNQALFWGRPLGGAEIVLDLAVGGVSLPLEDG